MSVAARDVGEGRSGAKARLLVLAGDPEDSRITAFREDKGENI